VAADPVGLGAYNMDSHNCQRIVQGGVVKNEGDVQAGSMVYGISYRSIVPRADECENLLVPWALSASHIAFGSIRMEPVFMILGQSAATAAAFAIDDGLPAQQLSYAKLALQLMADNQLLTSGVSGTSGIVVDNADPAGVSVTGSWTPSTSTSTTGWWGANYLHDESTDKGNKSVRFTPNLPAAGDYDVYLRWTAHTNRSTNVPVDVISTTGTATFVVNQQQNGGTWYLLGRERFDAGTSGSVLVRTTGTTAGTYVIADAAMWVAAGTGLTPSVQIVASDADTREGTGNAARFTLVRPSADSTNALTVSYTVSGTAQPGDYNALSGTAIFAAGAATATINVGATGDALAEGTETLTLTVQPGAGYSAGPLSSATVRLLDRPIDDWRHAHFDAAELADPARSGDAADPDHDALTNLLEYALALDPHVRDAVSPHWSGHGFTLTYSRRKSATDVTLAAEGSHNLATWGTAGVVEQIATVDEGDTERITVRLIPLPNAASRGFLRLRAVR
jgi:hypothetical protein